MKRIIILMVMLFLIPFYVIGDSIEGVIVREYCINTSHLMSLANWSVSVNGGVIQMGFEQPHYCTFGCAEDVNECAPKPYVRQMYLIGVFLFAFVVLFLILKMRGK